MNTTGLSNITGFSSLVEYTNNATSGLLMTGGLIVLFLIVLIVLMRNENEHILNVLATSSWSFFIVSIFFWFAHLVATPLVLGFLVIAAVSTFLLYATS